MMKPLTAAELLTVWEQGMNDSLLHRIINLLALACPGMNADSVAKLTIGERDARLLLLRERMFGNLLANMAECPQCSERLEWETDINDIRIQSSQQEKSAQEFRMEIDEFSIDFRLPNSLDISNVIDSSADQPDPVRLLSRCILDSRCRGEACEIEALPRKVMQALNRRMAEEDPQADICMLLNCPNCSHEWNARFDVAGYLWTEIERWAVRMLHDVHRLAGAYHWSENDILNMSQVRRQLYLSMVNG